MKRSNNRSRRTKKKKKKKPKVDGEDCHDEDRSVEGQATVAAIRSDINGNAHLMKNTQPKVDGGEDVSFIEQDGGKENAIWLCVNSKIFSEHILPWCRFKDVLNLRLVSKSFQENSLNYVLNSFYINMALVKPQNVFRKPTTNFKLVKVKKVKNVAITHQKWLVEQMTNLKTMQCYEWRKNLKMPSNIPEIVLTSS